MPDSGIIASPIHYIAATKKTKRAVDRAKRFADRRGPLLITGPSGSGKSYLAECIHNWSHRAGGPCVKRGCGEIDNETIASTLFGHKRGAFTGAIMDQKGLFEIANGGTLILDDIDYLPLKYQAHLLRFLDDYKFNPLGDPQKNKKSEVTLIATSNKNLEAFCKGGQFLPDLYNRLSRFEIKTQALYERPQDIEELAIYYLEKHIQEQFQALSSAAFDPEALMLLKSLDYPGNIRGLDKVIANIVSYLEPQTQLIDFKMVAGIVFDEDYPLAGCAWNNNLSKLHQLLDMTKWNIALTSKIAGICRNTLYKHIREQNWKNPYK
jgi:DNA-binding NtrC family response regulator